MSSAPVLLIEQCEFDQVVVDAVNGVAEGTHLDHVSATAVLADKGDVAIHRNLVKPE
jgi:hypothetical protein